MNSIRNALLAVTVLALGTSALGAQGAAQGAAQSGAAADVRWQAWIGCWAPVAGENGMPRELGAMTLARVCVTPAAGTSAVEVSTIASGKVVDRQRIEVDGMPHQVSRDGCTGTETARWANTGTRVYVSTDLSCAGGVTRRGRGVLSFSQRYEWLDVRGMASGTSSGVSVARYVISDDTAGLPVELRTVATSRTKAANNSLLAAAAPLTLADIADVAVTADSGVATTWLMERTQGVRLSINGKQLEMLADQGVPPAVIDVVVAIAHPNVFALHPNSRDAQFKTREVTSGMLNSSSATYIPGIGFTYGWSPYSGMYSPYYSSFYGYGNPYYGYSNGYGNGYGYGYGGYSPYYGYYPGSQPIIVVTRGSDANPTSEPHGRVAKGGGYSSGSSSSSAGGSSSSSSGSSGSSSGGSSSSGSSSGGSSSGGSASSGGGDVRTAVRKPPQP